MARVTVEDCVLRIPNRFELVALAGQRARNISAGAELTIDRDRDKNPVVALREIAEQTIDLAALEEAMIASNQRNVESERSEEDMAVALLASPGSAASARPANEDDDELDLASMAAELKAQAGEFKRTEED